MYRSIIALCLALVTESARADDIAGHIARLRAVGKEGAGNVAAARSLRALADLGPAALLPVLEAFDDAPPVATQWLSAAVELIADRALAEKKPLPADKLEAFLSERKHAARGRLLAFEWLCRADDRAAKRWLPDLLDDPCLELRRRAVAALVLEAQGQPAPVEAIALYRRALTAARDKDQADAIIAALEKFDVKTDRARHFGFIRDWQLLGPFDNPKGNNFDMAFAPEKAIDLKATYAGKREQQLAWRPHHSDDDEGLVDLAAVLAKEPEVIAYALAVVRSDAARPVEVRAASNNSVQLFLNGKRIYAREISHQGRRIDQHVGKGALIKGDNQVLIKVCLNDNIRSSPQWSFQVRLCDELGAAMPVQVGPVAEKGADR